MGEVRLNLAEKSCTVSFDENEASVSKMIEPIASAGFKPLAGAVNDLAEVNMERKRLAIGFGCGVLGTVAMSIPMVAATAAGIAPMPKPIPAAIMAGLLGPGTPRPALMLLAASSHLFYGGTWAAALAAVVKRPTVWTGIALGAGLWLIMQIAVLPALGWGLFGTAITPKIAVATLVLHLIYGATTGYLLQRFAGGRPRSSAQGPGRA